MSLTIERYQQHGVRVATGIPVIVPLLLVGVGLALAVALSVGYRVECVRLPSGQVNATVRSELFGCTGARRTITDVRGVRMDAHLDDSIHPTQRTRRGWSVGRNNYSTPTFRLALVDRAGVSHPVRNVFRDSRSAHEAEVRQLEDFLADATAARVVVRHSTGPWGLLGVGILALGVLFASFGRSETTVDAARRCVRLKPRGPAWGAREIPLEEVAGFDVILRRGMDADTASSWRPVLLRVGGEQVPIAFIWAWNEDKTGNAVNALNRALAQARGLVAPPGGGEPRTDATIVGPPPPPPPTRAPAVATGKICTLCGQDCGEEARIRDHAGRYYHERCYLAPTDPLRGSR